MASGVAVGTDTDRRAGCGDHTSKRKAGSIHPDGRAVDRTVGRPGTAGLFDAEQRVIDVGDPVGRRFAVDGGQEAAGDVAHLDVGFL